jgi:hypothetical protein
MHGKVRRTLLGAAADQWPPRMPLERGAPMRKA